MREVVVAKGFVAHLRYTRVTQLSSGPEMFWASSKLAKSCVEGLGSIGAQQLCVAAGGALICGFIVTDQRIHYVTTSACVGKSLVKKERDNHDASFF